MGVMPLTRRDGDRVAGIEQELLITQAVFEAAGEQVQNLVAVRVAMTRIGLTGRNDHMAEGHRG